MWEQKPDTWDQKPDAWDQKPEAWDQKPGAGNKSLKPETIFSLLFLIVPYRNFRYFSKNPKILGKRQNLRAPLRGT